MEVKVKDGDGGDRDEGRTDQGVVGEDKVKAMRFSSLVRSRCS